MAKIAVIARERKNEALRMSIGLTVLSDKVDIFLTDTFERDETNENHLEAIGDLKLKVYSTVPGTEFEYISPEELADKLLEYDKVVPY
ncbi:MAG: hypothetical protein KAQ85_03610 [Thermodesulfovibrionia bacterium]|nr:hypothetical protein [Thermodesulfovibrionia bacterium]